MTLKATPLNQTGFTLVEIIAVLIILSVLAAIVVPRFIDLDTNARARAIDSGVAELNGRESLSWAKLKISENGYDLATGDESIWEMMRTSEAKPYPYLGDDYIWTSGPTAAGGSLRFKEGPSVNLLRTASEPKQPAFWTVQ